MTDLRERIANAAWATGLMSRKVANQVAGCALREQYPARELLCMICGSDYPVWYAPNDLWNRVVRRPDGSDEWDFLCPGCFTRIAAERGEDERFVVSARAAPDDGLEAAARVCEGRAKTLTGDAKWEAMKCAAAIRGFIGHMELAAPPTPTETP